jgi:hypothetical protein
MVGRVNLQKKHVLISFDVMGSAGGELAFSLYGDPLLKFVENEIDDLHEPSFRVVDMLYRLFEGGAV